MAKLIGMRIWKRTEEDPFELVIDFDNDRYHAARFNRRIDRDEIASALHAMAERLKADRYLD